VHLLPGESEISRCRQHVMILVVPFIGYAALIAIGIYLNFLPASLRTRLGGFDRYTRWVVLLLIVAGVVGALVRWGRWRVTSYLLTNQRIVRTTGLGSRTMVSIALEEVQDVRLRQRPGPRMIGAGDVMIESASRQGIEVLAFVPHAEDVCEQVQAAVEARREGAPSGPGGIRTGVGLRRSNGL
jgi:uncharacterized membrane protein YdbT with pleckstrin-like domain